MIAIELLLALFLAAGLAHWVSRRVADRFARVGSHENGTTINLHSMNQRIAKVRSDFVAESRMRTNRSAYHDELMEAARQALTKMAFFHDRISIDIISTESSPRRSS